MVNGPLVLLALVCTGVLAWALAALCLLALLARLVVLLVRPVARGGKHRAPGLAPATGTAENEAPPAGRAGLSRPALCPAEQRTTLHAFHGDGSRTCWTCSTSTEAGHA